MASAPASEENVTKQEVATPKTAPTPKKDEKNEKSDVPKKQWDDLAPIEIPWVDFVKRFIYTNDYTGHFITGSPEPYFKLRNHEPLLLWIQENPKPFIETILELNQNQTGYRRKNIFYLIAVAMTSTTLGIGPQNKIKEEIREIILKDLVKSDDDMFDYIRYYTILIRKGNKTPKLTKTLRKLVVKFYDLKTPTELAKSVTSYERLHGWSHKDLIKLSHYKSSDILTGHIMQYVLFGLKKIEEIENPDFEHILKHIKTTHELRTTVDTERACVLIDELKANIKQINSKLNKDIVVWSTLIPYMNIREILQYLIKFYRRGWLKIDSPVLKKISEVFNSKERVEQSNIHPIEVFIYRRVFEKGGKKLDPKFLQYLAKKDIKNEVLKSHEKPVEPKCVHLTPLLKSVMKHSYNNVKATCKKYLITFDNSKSDTGCLHNRIVTLPEAYFSVLKFITKMEQHVNLAVYVDNKIVLLDDLVKAKSATELEEKLLEQKVQYIIPSAPIQWALKEKKSFDVFINFINPTWMTRTPKKFHNISVSEILKKYSEAMNLPDVKLVRFALSSNKIGDTEYARNILTIGGFTTEVPRVLEAFIRDNFV